MTARFRMLVVALAALALVGAAGCAQKPQEPAATGSENQASGQTGQETTETPSQEDGLYTPSYKPTGEEIAVIKTDKGTIEVKLYGEDAPIHTANFVELAQADFYNDTKFHRYIEGFVVQGGDPDTKEASSEQVAAEAAKGDGGGRFGVGGPGYNIKGEFDPSVNPNKHVKGALGMARSASPDSAGSQFYFCLGPLPQLDGGYTVFGQVTKGMDVMESLRAGDAIQSIEIRNAGN